MGVGAVVTTRAGADSFSRSSSRFVSRNGAKWLTAIVSSRPSSVSSRRPRDEPGVVHEHVDALVALEQQVGEPPYLVRAMRSRPHGLRADLPRDRGRASGSRPTGTTSPRAGELDSRPPPDPRARAGDHDGLAVHRDQSSKSPSKTAKTAPWGSAIAANLPFGTRIVGTSTLPPSSRLRLARLVGARRCRSTATSTAARPAPAGRAAGCRRSRGRRC